MVPAQLPRRSFEYGVSWRAVAAGFVHERVVRLEHRKMQLRDEHVRIVPRIANNRDAVCVPLHVSSVEAKQELRGIVALIEEWMTGGSVAVQAFKINLRAARILAQFRGTGMTA